MTVSTEMERVLGSMSLSLNYYLQQLHLSDLCITVFPCLYKISECFLKLILQDSLFRCIKLKIEHFQKQYNMDSLFSPITPPEEETALV